MMKRWRSSHEREGELLRHQINNPVCSENVQVTADRKIVKIAHSQKAVSERPSAIRQNRPIEITSKPANERPGR
jgi:hypothetical protein